MHQSPELLIPSQEESVKILEQICKEESINNTSLQVQRKQDEAIFIEDSPQNALEKLLTLDQNSFKEKLAYTKHIGELLPLLGEEGVQSLSKIFDLALNENDEIKKALITQLPQICQFLQTRSTGYQEIKNYVVSALQKLLESPNIDIKEEAGKEIAKIAPYLSEDDRGNLILTKVINMAHDEQNEENKIVAVQLFGHLSPIFGQALTESFVAFEILSMGEDIKLRVRKEAVLQIANISKVVTASFFKARLLTFFYKKCEEKTWQTKKACVDVIVEISRICPMSIRESDISDRMLQFLVDSNKWVKAAAYKTLGQFIETLNGSQYLNEKLLDHYVRMIETEIRDLGVDKEILQHCAFNFPAVLNVYGPQYWSQLQKLFVQLIKINDRGVKRPLACSLHEIGKILGPQKTERDLLPILDQILKDPNDEVKFGSIQNLSQFFSVFEADRREGLLDILVSLQKDQKRWRVREQLARQLHALSKIFSCSTVFHIILPISVKLCNDNVSIVRKQAAKQMYGILDVMNQPGESNPMYKQCVVDNIKAFAQSQRFTQRQTFVKMCGNLMNLEEGIFESQFIQFFKNAAQDPVKNVRISVAKTIIKHINKKARLSTDLGILEILQSLEQDKKVFQ